MNNLPLRWLKQGWRPLMDLPPQWQQQWGLLHDNKDGEGPFCLSTNRVTGNSNSMLILTSTPALHPLRRMQCKLSR